MTALDDRPTTTDLVVPTLTEAEMGNAASGAARLLLHAQLADADMDTLDAAALRHVEAGRRDNTIQAYAQDWDRWQEFCHWYGVPLDTARVFAYVGFVEWLHTVKQAAPNTIARRITGVTSTLRGRGIEVPKACTTNATARLDQIRHELDKANITRGRGQAAALTPDRLREILNHLTHDLPDLRARAVLLLGFRVAARRSELANLLVSDLEPDTDGFRVAIRGAKTGTRRPPVPYAKREATCAVRAVRAWQEAAGITDGHLFRSIHKTGKLGQSLSAKSVGAIIAEAGRRAGLDIDVTAHGLRVGFITAAFDADVDVKGVSEVSGHDPAGRTIHHYHQRSVEFRTNANHAIPF